MGKEAANSPAIHIHVGVNSQVNGPTRQAFPCGCCAAIKSITKIRPRDVRDRGKISEAMLDLKNSLHERQWAQSELQRKGHTS